MRKARLSCSSTGASPPRWEYFRLADGSPGNGAGKGGRDLRADVHLVDLGPAYDKWKKTPNSQKWLNASGQTK